jgi:hypothetical protein
LPFGDVERVGKRADHAGQGYLGHTGLNRP